MKTRENVLLAGEEREYHDCYLSLFGKDTTGVFQALQDFPNSTYTVLFRRGGSIHVIEFPGLFQDHSLAEFEAFRVVALALGKHLHERCPQLDVRMFLGTGLGGGYERTA